MRIVTETDRLLIREWSIEDAVNDLYAVARPGNQRAVAAAKSAGHAHQDGTSSEQSSD